MSTARYFFLSYMLLQITSAYISGRVLRSPLLQYKMCHPVRDTFFNSSKRSENNSHQLKNDGLITCGK